MSVCWWQWSLWAAGLQPRSRYRDVDVFWLSYINKIEMWTLIICFEFQYVWQFIAFPFFADNEWLWLLKIIGKRHFWKSHSRKGEGQREILCNENFKERGYYSKGKIWDLIFSFRILMFQIKHFVLYELG